MQRLVSGPPCFLVSYLVVRHHGPLGTAGVDRGGSHQARQDGVVDDHLVVEGPEERHLWLTSYLHTDESVNINITTTM